MSTACILVANACQARLYKVPKLKLFNGNANLELLAEIDHPESRLKNSELTADRAGHSGRGTMVESSDPKAQEVEQFAREIADMLENGRLNNHYEEVIIAAPPHFHGVLNRKLSDHVCNMVSFKIDKDYTKDDRKQLLSHLQDHL